MGAVDAVVAGHICLDIIPDISDAHIIIVPGRVQEIGPAILSTGGSVSNTGLALNRLGIRTRLMGKVGNDFFGQAIKQLVGSHGVGLADGMIDVPGEASSYTVILSPPGVDRMFLHCPGCNNTFSSSDVDYEVLVGARLFHFGYPPIMKRMIENDGLELTALLRRAKETGITTSLDMCMPDPKGISSQVDWRAILARALQFVDIFLPSLEEILFILYPDKLRQLDAGANGIESACQPGFLRSVAADLLAMGPAIVGLKLGHFGLYLETSNDEAWARLGRACPAEHAQWLNRRLWSPCFDTTVVGTTGAGDATIAGFLAAFLRGETPEGCLMMACAVGACNVEAADALGGLLDWEQTKARVKGGWIRKRLPPGINGWQPCPQTGVWYSLGNSG